LNDEVIHYFYTMLAQRDAEICKENSSSSKKRCHFFKSFFITRLLDEGVTNRYSYGNVKRWSKNVPGKDIFGLDKVFIPVNMSNVHWTCVVIFVQERKIQFFDSMAGDGMYYMKALLQYLKDEWASKNNGQELPHLSEWKLVSTTLDTPRQKNGYDCGVFTCMFADFLSMDSPLSFTQEHITQCRERIALSILQGYAINGR
jgi:sentrin-specific protease 1